MLLLQKLKTLPLFVDYFFRVVDQHSLQAPFVYEFYSKLKKGIQQTKGINEIEQYRESLLKDNSIVEKQDFGAGSHVLGASKRQTYSMIARHGISSQKECIFLSELVKIFQPKTCIELGTSLGVSTAYLAKSGSINSLFSFEGNRTLAGKATSFLNHQNCTNVQIIEGNIDDELPKLLKDIKEIDFVVIDANHTQKALLAYFDLLIDKIHHKGIIVIDDIRWSTDMYIGWKKLIKKEGVSLSIEFLNQGVLIFEKGIPKQHYVLSY